MSLLTPFLKLFKWDTTNETDLNSEFNVDKSMNDNWDKLDAKAQEYDNLITNIEDNISDIQDKNTQQDELIQKLQANSIQESTEEATSLHVEDASNLPAVLSVRGNHYQEKQESTSNLAILQEGTIEQNGNKVVVENGIATLSGTNSSDTVNYVKVGTAYLYSGKTYYINNIRTLNMGSHGALLRSKTGAVKWFTANTELEWECTNTSEWDIEISYSAGQYANGTEKFLISETSGAEWVQGKKAIPSLEYPSEIETIKDNIKIIQCNSNFLKKQEEAEVTERGLTGQVLEDGTIILNGTTINATYIQITNELKFMDFASSANLQKHVLPKGEYNFSVEKTGQTNSNSVHAYLRTASSGQVDFEVYLMRIAEGSGKKTTFKIDENKSYVAYMYVPANVTFTDFTMKFMLKRADDTSEYIQNEQKEYNLAVQQEMLEEDYFDLENNEEIHNWNKVTLNGTENININANTDDYTEFKINNVLPYNSKSGYNTTYSTHFNYTTNNRSLSYNKDLLIRIPKTTNLTTVELFKTWLQENNVNVYYQLAEAIELDLTEEQQRVLNELNNLELFKGTNNIYTEQDLALLQLDYTVDTKMYIDSKIKSQNTEGES